MEAEALVDTLPDTLSEVVAKKIAHTLSCVEPEAPVKTEADTDAGVKAYTVVDTETKLKLRHWCIRRLTRFRK